MSKGMTGLKPSSTGGRAASLVSFPKGKKKEGVCNEGINTF